MDYVFVCKTGLIIISCELWLLEVDWLLTQGPDTVMEVCKIKFHLEILKMWNTFCFVSLTILSDILWHA